MRFFGWFRSVELRGRQMLCGLRGHDRLLHFTEAKIALRCVSCCHETPGIVIDGPAPRVTARGDARRHQLYPRLAARRIA